jgi:hypothetical protein
MKWCQIQTDYPDQFVLLKNYRTEPVDDNHFRVTGFFVYFGWKILLWKLHQ